MNHDLQRLLGRRETQLLPPGSGLAAPTRASFPASRSTSGATAWTPTTDRQRRRTRQPPHRVARRLDGPVADPPVLRGRRVLLSGNCGGYGDACTSLHGHPRCGLRQAHASDPLDPPEQRVGLTLGTAVPPGSYNGPCGWEDHCESGIATQARWDFVNRDLVAAPTSMDIVSAWQLADRLFYTSMPQACATCTPARRAAPNDLQRLRRGQHLHDLSRHGRRRGRRGQRDAPRRGHLRRPEPARHRVRRLRGRHQPERDLLRRRSLRLLSAASRATTRTSSRWTTGGANATRYFVFRNETGCSAGFTRIATVTAPTLTYTDTACYNGVTYYYRSKAAHGQRLLRERHEQLHHTHASALHDARHAHHRDGHGARQQPDHGELDRRLSRRGHVQHLPLQRRLPGRHVHARS